MYRNVVYNSYKQSIQLFTWNENGDRVVDTVNFKPYLYLEDNSGDKTTIFGTKAKKKIFNNTFDRNRFVKESGIKRVYENLPSIQQYLIDSFWRENESVEFSKHPLRTVFLDIETHDPLIYEADFKVRVLQDGLETLTTVGELAKYSESHTVWDEKKQLWSKIQNSVYITKRKYNNFPNPEEANHTVNIITCYDNFTCKFHTFGLAPYECTEDNIIYHHCRNEKALFLKFIEYIEADYPDILSGWNCIEENQHVWLSDRISKIKNLSNNYENIPLKKYGVSINNFMDTGKKEEFMLKTEHGDSVLCSKDHRFMVYRRHKGAYKNYKTLTKELLETSVEDIQKTQDVYDYYAVKHLNINSNRDMTYVDLVSCLPKLKQYIVNECEVNYVFNLTTKRRECDNFTVCKAEIISQDMLQWVGFIFTDGSFDKTANTYRVTSKYSNLIADYTDMFCREHSRNLTPYTTCQTKFKEREFVSYIKQVGINNKIGILHNIIYSEDNIKHPNIEILSRLSHTQFIAFFSGMIDGDGWVESCGISLCNYDCIKYNFLQDIQELLLWNGVQSRLHKNYITINSNNINKKFITNLRIQHPTRSEALQTLSWRDIKNTSSKNIQWMYGGDDKYIVRILPIKNTGRVVQMFDITTDTHTFLCNGIHTHNCEGFDFPYIINRIEKILGQEYVNRLSPVGSVYFRLIRGKFGREVKRYYIGGISCIDYLDIYRRFCLTLRESYKLNEIAEIELGERKVDYGDLNIITLADVNWNLFVKYNIQDVNLLIKLEKKLQYIALLRMLSYVGLTTLESAMGTISIINGALVIKARNRGEILSTFIRSAAEGKNPGAYVSEPKRGFKENIVSFDANSLYPNVMIALNLSPETKVGKLEKVEDGFSLQHVSGKTFNLTLDNLKLLIKKEQLSLTKAGFLFSQKKKGIIPEFLDHYYSERVIIKAELYKLKEKLNILQKDDPEYQSLKFEVERLNTKQMIIKILCNSCYGYMGNKQAPIGDDDIASSVTLTGQAVIKQAGSLLQTYLTTNFNITDQHTLDESWVYSDTDSCYFSLECIKNKVPLKDGEIISDRFYETVNDLEKYLNAGITTWAKKELLTNDSRFVFKRECIADVALFLQKKRYVMHILDDEGIKVDKFKYTGVEVVRTTMPNAIKPYAKKIIETMMLTQSQNSTNKILNETFDIFKKLKPEEIAFVMGVKGYEKYAPLCKEFNIVKGMPIHVKSAYYHNLIMSKQGGRVDLINSGDKIRYLYVEKQNKYGITSIGFKNDYVEEFKTTFKIDYELMFEKILFSSIERFYNSVQWRIRKPTDNVQTELSDLFGF